MKKYEGMKKIFAKGLNVLNRVNRYTVSNQLHIHFTWRLYTLNLISISQSNKCVP